MDWQRFVYKSSNEISTPTKLRSVSADILQDRGLDWRPALRLARRRLEEALPRTGGRGPTRICVSVIGRLSQPARPCRLVAKPPDWFICLPAPNRHPNTYRRTASRIYGQSISYPYQCCCCCSRCCCCCCCCLCPISISNMLLLTFRRSTENYVANHSAP